jgi:hypothetical protein
MPKEPNETLVMTTCQCRLNKTNLVMTRAFFEERLQAKLEQGVRQERWRIVQVLKRLPFYWAKSIQMIELSKDEVIALVEGKEDE